MAEWEGIADADAHLGRAFPLPGVGLPHARWVDVAPVGSGAEPPPQRDLAGAGPPEAVTVAAVAGTMRTAPLEAAEPSLRPVTELTWQAGGLHLRLTAQGPWTGSRLIEIAASIAP